MSVSLGRRPPSPSQLLVLADYNERKLRSLTKWYKVLWGKWCAFRMLMNWGLEKFEVSLPHEWVGFTQVCYPRFPFKRVTRTCFTHHWPLCVNLFIRTSFGGWQLTGHRVLWEWNLWKPSLEKRSREMGPESLKGLLQCGALGSTELERSGWKIRALQEKWQEQNTNSTSSSSSVLPGMGSMWAHTSENNSFHGDLIFPPCLKRRLTAYICTLQINQQALNSR